MIEYTLNDESFETADLLSCLHGARRDRDGPGGVSRV